MIDINNPLLKAYYDALSNAIERPDMASVFVGVYEGEEPDNLPDPIYIVINSVTSSDNSNKHLAGTISNIQVGIYGWKNKYGGNTRLYTNDVAGSVMQIINPTPQSTLVAPGIGIIGTKVSQDTEQQIGVLAGRKFVNRILIFSHYIYT